MIDKDTVLNHRYRLLEQLGRGGMGTVWRARDAVTEQDIAVKVLNPGLLEDPTATKRFRREAKAVAGIGHPGVVGVHDYGESGAEGTGSTESTDSTDSTDSTEGNGADGTDSPKGADTGPRYAYIVMDLVEGRPLSAVQKDEGPMPPERALAMVATALDALQAVHQSAIVHRDVKPSNLLVREDGAVLVADFGLALAIADSKLTTSNGFIGTASYASPEQVDPSPDNPVTPAADLYSMGVVCYELLVGKLPFEGGRAMQVAYKHVNEPAPELPDTFPPAVRALVAKALSKAPEDRYESAAEMAAAARAAVGLPVGEAAQRPVRLWKSAPRTGGAGPAPRSEPVPTAELVVKVSPVIQADAQQTAEQSRRRSRRRRLLVPVIIPVVVSLGTAGALLVDRNPFSADAAPGGRSTTAVTAPPLGGTGVPDSTAPVDTPAATPPGDQPPGTTPDQQTPQQQRPVPPASSGGNGGTNAGNGGGANNGGANSGGTTAGQNGGTQPRQSPANTPAPQPPVTNNPAPQPPPQNSAGGTTAQPGGGSTPPPESPARPAECGGTNWTRIISVQSGLPIGLANDNLNASNPVVLGGATQYGWVVSYDNWNEYHACNSAGYRLIRGAPFNNAVTLGNGLDFAYRWTVQPAASGGYTLGDGTNCMTAGAQGKPITMTTCTDNLASQLWKFQ
ncbi:protein kinase [Kitasatospora sp. NPDC058184]|uniref:serine/threonine protein kinase n=1 Tax=Kitasatospora sp. NPDC058184 TaxID=3346370 RepID=UPI0036DF1526